MPKAKKTIVAPNPDALRQDKQRLGELVYQARKAAGLSQAKLGSQLGVSEDTIASLEHGGFSSYDLAYAAVQYFHFSLDELFSCPKEAHEAKLQDAMDGFVRLLADSEKRIAVLQHKLKY